MIGILSFLLLSIFISFFIGLKFYEGFTEPLISLLIVFVLVLVTLVYVDNIKYNDALEDLVNNNVNDVGMHIKKDLIEKKIEMNSIKLREVLNDKNN